MLYFVVLKSSRPYICTKHNGKNGVSSTYSGRGLLTQRVWDRRRSGEEPDDILIRGSEAITVFGCLGLRVYSV